MVQPSEIMVVHGSLHRGYEYPLIRLPFSRRRTFSGGKKKKRRKQKAYEGRKIQSFSELKPGDYVVHENHALASTAASRR